MEELATLLVNGGIVTALIEATKKSLGTRFDWNRWGAWVALVTGVATAVGGNELGWYPVAVDTGQAVFSGLMAGIVASGLNRGVTQNAPTVVVRGDVAAANGAATNPARPAPNATAVLTEPAVTDNAEDAGVSRAMDGVARPAAPPSGLPSAPKGL